MPPRIVIPHPTSFDLAYNRLNLPAFSRAVTEAGGAPIFLDLSLPLADQARLAATCQGIVLPGSPADVSPATYGQEPGEHTAPPDPAREAADRMLIEHAYEHEKPLLTVCFGTQMLNVRGGGTLIQDLAILPVNHAASSAVLAAHPCACQPGSLMSELVDEKEVTVRAEVPRFSVNSSHHQAIGIAAPDLKVSARSPQDGVVEAIEPRQRSRHFVLGVQWHPERTLDISQTSRNLFARLVAEAG